MFEQFKNKRILYIATKNLDYLRIVQEISLLKKFGQHVEVIGSSHKSYVVRLLRIYWQLLKLSINKYEIVFIGFAPQLILPFWKKKLMKKPVYIDFFISIYDTMVFDRKRFQQQSFMARVCYALDQKTLSFATEIVVDTHVHGMYFATEFHIKKSLFHVLYLEADPQIYYPRIYEKKDKNKFEILYFGSILPLQGIEVIMEAIRILKVESNIYFTIIGPVPEKVKEKTANVAYIEWLSQQELAEHIGKADLCLAGHFNKDIMKARRTIAGKSYIYEAMKKPMILGDNEANKELFKEDELHHFVPMGNGKALADMIIRIKKGYSDE